MDMKTLFTIAGVALGMSLMAGPALAVVPVPVPEPVSLSLVAGGAAAIAAVRMLRRK
jgi:hypothetical protein